MTIGIYCIRHIETSKRYVGKSINIEARWCAHRSRKTSRHLSSAIALYGVDAFAFEVLEVFCEVDEEQLAKSELKWMDHYKTCDRDFGYNLVRDSGSNLIVHDETRQRMREAWKKRPAITFETKMKYSAASKRRWADPEISKSMRAKLSSFDTRKKMSDAKKNISDETRAKIGEASRGRKHSTESLLKLSASLTGRQVSLETRDKIAKSLTGRTRDAEVRLKISQAAQNMSAESRARILNGQRESRKKEIAEGKQRRMSPETLERMSIAAKNRSPEYYEKLAERNRNMSPETKKKISDAAKRQHARKKENCDAGSE